MKGSIVEAVPVTSDIGETRWLENRAAGGRDEDSI